MTHFAILLLIVSAGFFLMLFVSSRKTERYELMNVIKEKKGMAFLTGMGIYLTYTINL